jgi:hypothetical protein
MEIVYASGGDGDRAAGWTAKERQRDEEAERRRDGETGD